MVDVGVRFLAGRRRTNEQGRVSFDKIRESDELVTFNLVEMDFCGVDVLPDQTEGWYVIKIPKFTIWDR